MSRKLALAQTSDAPEIAALILSLSAWLLSKGVHQWANPNPEPEILADILAGKVFVSREQGKLVGTLTLVENSDPMWNSPAGALYLHRLAIVRELAGTGLGKELVVWAEAEAARRGFSLLRLDCAAANSVLREYYSSLGFEFREVIFYPRFNMEFALYEKGLIQSERCRLRRLVAGDLPAMLEMETDPDVMKFTRRRVAQTPSQIEERLARMLARNDGSLGIWLAEDFSGNPVGWFMLLSMDGEFPELGFMLPQRRWGQGFATEIAAALIKYGWGLGLKGISAAVDLDNFPSRRILEKLGFVAVDEENFLLLKQL